MRYAMLTIPQTYTKRNIRKPRAHFLVPVKLGTRQSAASVDGKASRIA